LFLSFLFGQVIGDTSYFKAQKELGTTIALAISMTFPVFTFILSLIFLNRPFEIKMLISLFLISSGIIIIGKNRMTNSSSESPIDEEKKTTNVLKSLSYGLIASLGWAIGLVIIDYSVNQIDDILNINGVSTIIGNVIRFPFALTILGAMVIRENIISSKINNIKSKKSTRTYILLTLGAVIGTSLGAFLYTEAARVAGANVMSLIATAAPLFALPLTYWVNKESISKIGFIGVVLTILGVVFILI
jgi:drug/metabolite transporter (DMT)-like permease